MNAGFQDPSALLKHELAYCLGQMKNTAALPILESVLANAQEDPMVRHEVSLLRTSLRVYAASRAPNPLGCRGNGCYFLGLICTGTQKVSERRKPFRARDMRDRASEDRMGPIRGGATTSREHTRRASVPRCSLPSPVLSR
jgi:hypothetical protein